MVVAAIELPITCIGIGLLMWFELACLNYYGYGENLQILELKRIWADLPWCYTLVFGVANINEVGLQTRNDSIT